MFGQLNSVFVEALVVVVELSGLAASTATRLVFSCVEVCEDLFTPESTAHRELRTENRCFWTSRDGSVTPNEGTIMMERYCRSVQS